MPRSGGVYTLPPGYFAVDGTTIEVSQHNPPLEDIAQALTDSLPRDGSAPMTGNLAMGSNKITGLAAATNPADAVRLDQLPTFTPTTATLTAGTDAQGQGPITTDQVTITTAAANPSGATLPTAVAGDRVIIANRGANPVNIYPATGAAIGALAANAPVLLAVNQSVEFFARSATQWEGQISQPLDADLTALAALATTGLVTRTAAGTMATRQIVSADGSVTITNPAGVAGDIDLSAARAEAFSSVVSLSGAAPITVTTAVPANCNYVELWFNGMSLNSNGHAFVQLGDTAFVTTGYDSAGNSNGSGGTSAAGLVVRIGVAAQAFTGVMVLRRTPGTNIWVSAYNGLSDGLASYLTGAGKITLAAPLERIRVTATAANDFDGGGTVYAVYR